MHNEQYLGNSQVTRFPNHIHMQGQTPFGDLFSVPAFADESIF